MFVALTPVPPPALMRRRPECYLGGDDGEGGAGRTPKSQGRDDGSAPGAGYKNKLRAVARGVVRGLEVLEVLHRAAPAAGVRHQSEPDFVLSMFMVRRDAVSLSFGAAHPFIEKNP